MLQRKSSFAGRVDAGKKSICQQRRGKCGIPFCIAYGCGGMRVFYESIL